MLFTEGSGTALPSIVSAEAIVRTTQFSRLVIPVARCAPPCSIVGLNLIVTFIFILADAGAQIGANAVVLEDVDPGATVVGIPARRL